MLWKHGSRHLDRDSDRGLERNLDAFYIFFPILQNGKRKILWFVQLDSSVGNYIRRKEMKWNEKKKSQLKWKIRQWHQMLLMVKLFFFSSSFKSIVSFLLISNYMDFFSFEFFFSLWTDFETIYDEIEKFINSNSNNDLGWWFGILSFILLFVKLCSSTTEWWSSVPLRYKFLISLCECWMTEIHLFQ